jgi:hypothetical protein
MIAINWTISINTLNVNDLNTQIKSKCLSELEKEKIQLYVFYERNT